MGKKVILSEEQIKSVIGINEENFYYLGGSNPVGNTETAIESPLDDRLGIAQHSSEHVFGLQKHKKTKHDDEDFEGEYEYFEDEDGKDEEDDDEYEYEYTDLGHMLTPSGYWTNRLGSYRTIASMTEDKKKINEDNRELKGLTFVYKDPNTGKKIAGSEKKLATRKWRAKKKGNKKEYDAISTALENRRSASRRRKKFNKNVLGMENVYQTKGGTKKHAGRAHTKKNKGPQVTYFN